jgi:hypothetical protein
MSRTRKKVIVTTEKRMAINPRHLVAMNLSMEAGQESGVAGVQEFRSSGERRSPGSRL